MVRPPCVAACAAALALAALAGPARADATAAPATPAPTEISREISVQPVLADAGRIDADHASNALDRAIRWAHSTSAGAWRITPAGLRTTIRVEGDGCSALTRGVALDRQANHADGTVTLYIGDAHDCPYTGLAETPGSWVLLPHLSPREDAAARTLAHELGHTLGLLHAGAETCAVLAASPRSGGADCTLAEYGDHTDPMGRGSLAWSLGPIARASLGWAVVSPVVGDGVHEVHLGAEEAIRVIDPVTGTTYVVAHRQPGPGVPQRSAGVHLYRMPHAHEREVTSVHLPWIASGARPWGGRAGMAFRSPSGAIGIEVRSSTGVGSEVTVTIDAAGTIADNWGPVFAGPKPDIRWRSATATLHVPRAFDQSGVSRYAVTIDERVIASRAARPGIDSWRLSLPRDVSRARTISVLAIDATGNATTIALGAGTRSPGR